MAQTIQQKEILILRERLVILDKNYLKRVSAAGIFFGVFCLLVSNPTLFSLIMGNVMMMIIMIIFTSYRRSLYAYQLSKKEIEGVVKN